MPFAAATVALQPSIMMNGPLILLSRRYDRTAALIDGRVQIGGQQARIEISSSVPANFKRMMTDEEVVAGEMSLGFHAAISAGKNAGRFVGLPIFLSKSFRHGNVFVRRDSSLESFSELAGKKVGLEEYAMTMGIWARALFEEAGVPPQSISWYTARDPVVVPEVEAKLKETLDLNRVQGRNMWDLLAEGEIDAVIGRPPKLQDVYDGPYRRLLRDHSTQQRRYYAERKLFPLMHLLVMRRAAYEERPELAIELYQAFDRARQLAMDDLRSNLHTLSVMLPLLEAHLEETVELFGADWWPYGVQRNLQELNAFMSYCLTQNLITEPLTLDRLFCPELIAT